MNRCPNCQQPLPDGALFCEKCGTRMAYRLDCPQPFPQSRIIRCNHCGTNVLYTPNSMNAFCPTCGNSLVIQGAETNKWTAGRYMALAGILATVMSSFLPFFAVGFLGASEYVYLWTSKFWVDAVILIAILGVALFFVLTNKKRTGICMIVCGVIVFVYIIAVLFITRGQLKDVYIDDFWGSMDLGVLLHPSFGFYLFALASIVMIVSGILIKDKK